MKEAFWGLMIVALGLFGVVAINLFSGVTTDNDRSYYILKESTEGAMYDSIDLAYYRLHGMYRIVEEKFTESVTERFMNNIDSGNYSIVVTDVNELPPKVSLFLKSGVTSVWSNSENISIINGVNAIIEAKYPVETITSFLNIDKEEYINITSKRITNDNYCDDDFLKDVSCITGEIKFEGWDDPTDVNGKKLPSAVCSDRINNLPEGYVNAKYRVCECNKWSEIKKTQAISAESFYTSSKTNAAKPSSVGSDVEYKWIFNLKNDMSEIFETYTYSIKSSVCTSGISIMVPYNWSTLERLTDSNYITRGSTSSSYYEPSKDNSKYIDCGSGIRIPVFRDIDGNYYTKYSIHAKYYPSNSINRSVSWSLSNGYLSKNNTYNPQASCSLLRLNSDGSNCVGSVIIEANSTAWNTLKNGGEVTTTLTANSLDLVDSSEIRTSGTCNITLYDGFITPQCNNITIDYETTSSNNKYFTYSYTPYNANFTRVKWSVQDDLVVFDENTGLIKEVKRPGTTRITVTAPYGGRSTTCTLTVNRPKDEKTSCQSNGCSGCDYCTYYLESTTNKWGFTYNNRCGSSCSSSCDCCSCDPPCSGCACYNGCALVSSSSGLTGCFAKGTKVTTKEGYKNIEDIEIGDMVLSYNYETKSNEYRVVTNLSIRENINEEMYKIIVNDELIYVTSYHKFYIRSDDNYTYDQDSNFISEVGYKWVDAEYLKVGDYIKGSDGNDYEITRITHEMERITVYNFEVENNRSYYVSDTGFLAHNYGSCLLSGTKVKTSIGYKNIEDIDDNDIVLSYNEDSKKVEYNRAHKVYSHTYDGLIYVIKTSNEEISATEEHGFYIAEIDNTIDFNFKINKKLYLLDSNINDIKLNNVTASELKVGDYLVTSDYKLDEIIDIETYETSIDVYNFDVSVNHNYYITDSNYLTHNGYCY